jgi:hypothetical protein
MSGLSSSGWIGSAIGAGANLLGGIFGLSGQRSANKANLQIAREQMRFNSEEAQKQRKWQEEYYQKYSSPIAQSAQYRAAGLNPYLANIQPQGVASGGQAVSGELPIQQNEMSSLASSFGSAANAGIAAYNSVTERKQQESQASLNLTMETLNKTTSQLRDAETALTAANEKHVTEDIELLRQKVNNLKFVNEYTERTLESRVRQQYMQEDTDKWANQNAEYGALRQAYSYFHIDPQKAAEIQASINEKMAHAFALYAQGKMSYTEIQYMPRKIAALETASYASLLNAQSADRLSKSVSKGYDIENEGNQMQLDFMKEDFGVGDYIKRNTNARHFFNLSLRNAEYFTQKAQLEPDLVKSMIEVNGAEVELTPWKKWDYGTHGLKNVGDAAKDFTDAVKPWSVKTETTEAHYSKYSSQRTRAQQRNFNRNHKDKASIR